MGKQAVTYNKSILLIKIKDNFTFPAPPSCLEGIFSKLKSAKNTAPPPTRKAV